MVLLLAGKARTVWPMSQDRGGVMTAQTLETDFHNAEDQTGDGYRLARESFIQRGPAALAFLQSRQSSTNWKTSLSADILVGWIQHRELFEKCTEAIRGNLTGTVPITGSFPPRRRIGEIVKLGKVVTPRVLEMLWKTHEYSSADEIASLFGSLVELRDNRATVPVIDLMRNASEGRIREWAASSLGPMKDKRAVSPLLEVLRDTRASQALKASAAMSLGLLGGTEAIPDLRAIVTDESRDMDLRKSAARALGDVQDSESTDYLLRAFSQTKDDAFQIVLLATVGNIGTPSVLPILNDIELKHEESSVREAAREARESIVERSGFGRD
jgi:hypothetical protein